MDILSLTKVASLFILTLIERDDGQKKQMVIASFVRMEAIMNILIGLNWLKTNGRKFIKLQELRVAVGCAGDLNMTARCIRKKLCELFKNQWSRQNEQKLNLCIIA